MRKSVKTPFNTEKDVLEGRAVEGAPVVGGEFITEDKEWQGQTVQVQSDKHLEDDLGIGEHVVLRTYGFAVNPVEFAKYSPTLSDLFESHKSGIAALLWQDGLRPMDEVDPRVFFSADRTTYFITVAAQPRLGQTVIDTSQTLSQIAHASKPDSNVLHGSV